MLSKADKAFGVAETGFKGVEILGKALQSMPLTENIGKEVEEISKGALGAMDKLRQGDIVGAVGDMADIVKAVMELVGSSKELVENIEKEGKGALETAKEGLGKVVETVGGLSDALKNGVEAMQEAAQNPTLEGLSGLADKGKQMLEEVVKSVGEAKEELGNLGKQAEAKVEEIAGKGGVDQVKEAAAALLESAGLTGGVKEHSGSKLEAPQASAPAPEQSQGQSR